MMLRSCFRFRPCARVLSACLLLSANAIGSSVPAPDTVLTTAAEVRALSEEEARKAVPVRLRGVFMGEADPEGIAFVIQDASEGIYLHGPAHLVRTLRRGDILEVEGVSDPGGFAPYVVAHSIRKIARGPIPEPIKVALDELNAGRMDAKWVEISGVVRSVEPKAPGDTPPPPPGTRYVAPSGDHASSENTKVKLKLASGSARVIVEIDGGLRPEEYVDAEVRVQGLCFNLHNHNRQFVRPFVQVPRGVALVVERPAPKEPLKGEPRPVSSLLRFEQLTGEQGHRVRVRGVVVHHRPGATLWLRDREHSLRVDTAGTEELRPGDEVDVLGFPALGEYSAVLEDAVFRKLNTREPPQPRDLTDVASALRNDADLVRMKARLVEVRRFTDSVALTLDWRQTVVRAQMDLPENAPAPDWLPGSMLEVAGVCSVVTDGTGPLGGLWEPSTFQLILRSPADVSLLSPPPWWSAERVVWVLSGFLALALGAVGVIMLATRRRVQDQEHRRSMAEAEFAAILSERNRVAREIHDTLSQSLGAISVQLELARTHAAQISAAARSHLAAAHQLARAALSEARESIWNMRSQVLERCDLGEALQGILTRMTEGTAVAAQMHVEGSRRRLPPLVENNLLRVGQEAITNAAKHAKPTCISVTLAFERRYVRLVVEDDGVGFSMESQPSRDSRSFGLVGIRERAELLGGKFEITSSPGRGTRVAVSLSV